MRSPAGGKPARKFSPDQTQNFLSSTSLRGIKALLQTAVGKRVLPLSRWWIPWYSVLTCSLSCEDKGVGFASTLQVHRVLKVSQRKLFVLKTSKCEKSRPCPGPEDPGLRRAPSASSVARATTQKCSRSRAHQRQAATGGCWVRTTVKLIGRDV